MECRMTMTPVEMMARLVAFPTVSDVSNLDLIAFVGDYLAGLGVQARVVPSADGTKANLWATIGPMVPGGVVLSGHTDVVPVVGQAWTSDPFTLTRRGDRYFGRGTCDMKGFDALALALVPAMLAAPLTRPIHIALSYDEEISCIGVPDMIADMAAQGAAPAAVIVGEPSRMQVVTGHKGGVRLDTRVTGHTVHSSQMHRGVSSVMVAARLITWLADRGEANRLRADPASIFDPPWTTIHCGVIHGGTAFNIVAGSCSFSTDIRAIPGEDPRDVEAVYRAHVADQVVPAMRAVHPATGIEVERIYFNPALGPEREGAAEALCRRLTGDNGTHTVPYGTEAGFFQGAGWSTIVCGPGDIAQAHQADEFIEVSELERGEAFLRRLIDDLCR
jgi:acetylornithine deacetylase